MDLNSDSSDGLSFHVINKNENNFEWSDSDSDSADIQIRDFNLRSRTVENNNPDILCSVQVDTGELNNAESNQCKCKMNKHYIQFLVINSRFLMTLIHIFVSI